MEENINPILNDMKDCFAAWGVSEPSWLGQLAAIKLVLLPKLIFVSSNAILEIPDSTPKSIPELINKIYLG